MQYLQLVNFSIQEKSWYNIPQLKTFHFYFSSVVPKQTDVSLMQNNLEINHK